MDLVSGWAAGLAGLPLVLLPNGCRRRVGGSECTQVWHGTPAARRGRFPPPAPSLKIHLIAPCPLHVILLRYTWLAFYIPFFGWIRTYNFREWLLVRRLAEEAVDHSGPRAAAARQSHSACWQTVPPHAAE